jgi:hypothetical protein
LLKLLVRWQRTIRLANAIVCLSGALLIHQIPNFETIVHAQERSFSTNSVDQYGLQTRVDIEQNLLDRLDAKLDTATSQINHHLENTDSRLDDLSNGVSEFKGIGTGILSVLGILNILGLINTIKVNKS